MTKTTITNFFVSLILGVALFSTSLSTSAQTVEYSDDLFVVNATSGLNLRNQNCEVIKVLPHKTWTLKITDSSFPAFSSAETPYKNAPVTKTCTVNGTQYDMILISLSTSAPIEASGYVAKTFLREVRSRNLKRPNRPYIVDAPAGLNIRNVDCSRVTSVPNNFELNDEAPGMGGFITICEVGGEYYDMALVPYKGEWKLAARAFLK